MVQYEDQEIEIDSPYSLSRFHQFYTDVCVCVCVSLPQSGYRMFHHHRESPRPFCSLPLLTLGNHQSVLHHYNFISRMLCEQNHIACNPLRLAFSLA